MANLFDCAKCDGTGKWINPAWFENDPIAMAFMAQAVEERTGQVDKETCPTCNGKGKVKIVIDVPLGKDCYGREHIPYRPLTSKEVEELLDEYQTINNLVKIEMIVEWIVNVAPVTFKGRHVRLVGG